MMVEDMYSVEWMKEKLERIPRHNWFYNFICFIMGKRKSKLTYLDLFLFVYGLNRDKIGEKEAKELAIKTTISIYEFNNNKKPNIYKNNGNKKNDDK